MAQWIIYGSNGVAKAKVKELELHDEWMAECFLTVSIKNATPISFAVGDYIDYRGERYTIQYDPNVIKKATSGSYGEGFTYDNIKFVGLQDEVVRCDFNDLVLNDNDMHYSALPTFPFYCESVDDLLDRIQANLEDLYPGQWIVIGLNTVRNSQRGTAVGRAQAFVNAYKQYIDPTGAAHTDPYGKQGVAETADHITCWDAMKKVHDDFDLNFIVRGRVIVVGTAGVFTANTFRYGKGNGLKEIERIGESDQRIVTRLRAYGSEENLPAHYYNTVNKQVYANVTSILHKFDTTGADFLLNLDFDKKYFTYRSESYPGTTETPNYIIEMKANDVTVRGYVTKDATSGKCYVYCESVAGDDDRDEPDATKMAAFVEALTANDRLDFVDYVNRDAFGEGHYDYATSHLPDNMAVSRLMLPGFPTMSLNAWVQAHKNDADKTWLAQAIADGFTFSTEIYRPYIDSPNKTQYGVRPGSVYFDGSDETENIHPTIEGMTYNDAPIDEIYAADQVEDNGVYPAGEEVKPIKITLPNLGFALDKYYEDGASIDMKNGMCGARSFKLTGKPKKNNDNRWVCEVERVHDDSLDLWFPYSDFQIHGSSEVGRDHGDKYILTGIDMPDAYIDAAAVKLLQYSIEALKKNHAPRYTYQPRIDNIFMQRQHDTASASQGVVSLHDTLKAGDVFAFADTDLNIDANVIIDILTIRENGDNGIPDYQITLRDEKQVGTIQKITNKVDSIISGATSINGATGGGLTTRQIQSLINRYGGEQFLSKLNDDTAAGYITMLKGLQVGANFVPDILGEGGVLRMRQDGKVELVTDILYARMRAYFDSVVIREYRHESGNRIKSPAQGFNASRVENIKVVDNVETIVDDASEADYFRCYWRVDDGEKKAENQFVVGDLAFCEHSDVVNGSLVTKRYWRVVTGRNAGNTTTEDGEAWIDLSNAHDANGNPVMTTISWEGQGGTTQTLSVKSFESSTNSVPEAHDDICMLGCTTDTTRQGAIIEYVSGTDAPTYQIYQGLGSDAANPYVLTNKNQIGFGYNSSTGKAYMNVYGDTYIGDRNRNTFLEYKQNGTGGVPELNIKAKIQILPNGSTIDGESISDYIKDNQNNYDDTEVQQAISDLNDAVGNLQDQIDGSIETLYGDVDPSVPANDPYKDYTTDEKEKHLGDMYYNSTTGYAYRYDKSVEEVGDEEVTTYFWQIIRDTGITQAIADAAAALGLAETKAKIFTTTAGTLPTPPYKINDVWVNATYPANGSTYSNEILKCVTARAQGATANIADWAKASKYTDDSSLQNFISATYDPTIAGLTEQVDRKIESWFQSADPSADWYDDTQTPILDVRADHVGDMWYSESTHLLKRYDSETTGEGEQAVTTYFWTTIQDQKAIDAYDNAAHAQDTADGKRRVFTAQPVAADAYDVGDLWVNATYPATGTKTYENDVLCCKTAKAAGVAFNISHWQKASKYTDDSALTNFVNGDYADTIGALEGQLDKKAETWYQAADPSSDWYVVDPETQEVTTDTRADHVGDLWYNTANDTTWYYKRSGAGTEQDPYTYEWKQQNVPLAVFDKIDGKADIFVSKPSTYNKYDMWIIESDTTTCPNTDVPTGCKRGDIVIAKNKRTNSYTKGDWEKKDRYTDDSAFNGYITAFLNGSGASGDSATAAAIQKAIAGALGSGTVVDGGLLLSSLIGMRKYKGSGSVTELSSYDTWGGISGEYNDDDETVEGGAKGHGIAAWYGGDMVDKEMLSDEEIANGWGTGEGQYRWAKGVDRFDGSGYRADGNITWDEQGRVSIKDVTTIISSNNTDVLNELITFNNAFHFNLSQGTSTVLSIEPQAAFTNLYIRNTTNPNAPYHVATENWVDDHYVSKTFFRQLFRAFKPNETAGQADVEVQPNTIDATISNIKAMVGFWTEQYVSALGNNSDGGGGGASVLYGLNDVTPNATGDGVMGAQDGYVLTYNGTTNHWYAAATAETYVLPQATADALGGIKIGYATSGKNYAIVLDANGKAYVNVPWTDHYDWGDITNTPTTIAGYGITDAYTKTEVDSLARLESVAFSSDGVLAFTLQDGSVSYVDLTHQHDFQEILERPTTLAGFGIDDAKIESGVITLGNNTITPVTSVAMTVPTGFSISGTPISKTGTLALSYSSGYEGFTTELKNMITALYSWFEVDSNGDIKTKDYTSNGTTKHRGFWSPSFVSALGQGSDSGGGGQGDVTWELLQTQATDDRYIHLSYISAALESYLTTNNYVQSSDISDMATKTWVGNQGYLTQQSLSSYYTKSEVDALARLTNVAYSSDGILAFTHQDGSTTYADFTHEHSFLELLDRPTTIAGYEISDVYINSGVVYIGDNSITPVTSVAMTVPTGFSISGSPISKTGTLAVSYASGYEGFTTSLKEKIEALFSWFELDSEGNVKTKDYVENGTTKHRGFWSESFISALGQGVDGGGGGQGDVTWALLASTATGGRTIDISYLTAALNGYATQSWVQSQGYITQAAVDVLEFLNTVTGGSNILTLTTNKGNSTIVDFTHNHEFLELTDRPTTIVGYGIEDAKIVNGVITLGTNTITPLTSHQSVTNNNISVTWNTETTIATIGSTAIKIKIPANPDTNTWRNIFKDGTEQLTTGINTKGLNFVGDGKTTITFLAAGTGEGQSGNANYATLKIGSTWRGIQDNLTSDSSTDSLSAKQGKALKGSITTLEGYFNNDAAKKADKLTTARSLWGNDFDGSAAITSSIIISTPKTGESDKYLQIGDIKLIYDATNNALHVEHTDATKVASFYAQGAISALGQGVDGGGGGQGDVTWALLADNTDTRQVALSHLTDALSGYSTTSHTHTTTIATDSGTNQLTLAYGTKYKITAGGTSFIFTMPSADDTNTWRNIYVAGTEKIGSAVSTKGLNFAAGSNVSLSFTAAGSGTGQNANYGTITISATDTTYSVATQSANGLMSAADKIKLDGLEYFNAASRSSDGVVTLTTNKSNTTILDLTHQHSFLELVDRPTTLAGYGITDAVASIVINGTSYLPANKVVTLPVYTSTQVDALARLKTLALTNDGLLTFTHQDNSISVVDFSHEHSFLELIDRPTTLDGYGITGGNLTGNLSVAGAFSAASGKINGNTILDSSNSSVSLSGETLTVKINGTSKSLTNTNTTYSANNGVGLSGTTFYNSGVRATTINGNYLRVNTNGTNADLTIPYATDADTCDGLHVHSGRNNEANKIVRTDASGYIQCDWINTTSGGFYPSDAAVSRVYCSNDAYLRYLSPSDFISKMSILSLSGGTLSGNVYINPSNGNDSLISVTNTNQSGTAIYLLASTNRGVYHSTAGWLVATNGTNSWMGIGNVGIGNSSPSYKLDVSGTGHFTGHAYFDDWIDVTAGVATQCVELDPSSGSGHGGYIDFHFNSSSADYTSRIIEKSSGTVTLYGNFYASGGVTCASDIRLKDIVGDTNLSVEQIAAAPVVTFFWKKDHSKGLQVGSIAQYWQTALPQSVTIGGDGELGLQYGVAALVAAITTARKVVDHEKRITELEKERDAWKEAYSFIKNAYEELKLKIA